MAKATSKITKRVVDAIKPDGTDFYVFDSELIGFGIRVRPSGAMSYIVKYTAGSGRGAPTKRLTLAKVGKITPDQAREAAKRHLADIVKGGDPVKERATEREALTVAALIDLFLEHIEAVRKPATTAQYRHMLKAYVEPAHGKDKATDLTPQQIGALHRKLKGKSITANRVRDIVSSMYGWAIKTKVLPKMDNPAAGTTKFKEKKRDRPLKDDELQRLGAAIREAEAVGIPWEPDEKKKVKHAPKAENRRIKIDAAVAAALRLYILTGARLREILHLTWSMVDFDRGVLVLPDSKTDEKEIILNGPALLILSELPRVDKFVIPGRAVKLKNGSMESRPRADLKRPWQRVRARAGLDAEADNPRTRLRIHDLRHSHASIGVNSVNLGLPLVGKLLGHSKASTTQRYVHIEDEPLRRASDAIARKVMEAMDGPAAPDAEVIPMRKGKR